jgi:ferredoxin
MNLAFLKKIRLIVSLMFFCTLTFAFLDLLDIIPKPLFVFGTYLQFVPSVIKFFTISSLAAAGFIFILALTLFFGRVYCSTICPLGVLQDIISFFSIRIKKIFTKKRFKYTFAKPHNILRYTLLIMTIFLIPLGIMTMVNLLDPYSYYGRIATYLFRFVGIYTNNALAYVLQNNEIYFLSSTDYYGFNWEYAVYPSISFIVILILSSKWGRLYCNTICPVGTLLGWLSKFSFFKIAIIRENCNSCGSCVNSCKSQCIDKNTKVVDFTRCVSCFNCFDSCPTLGFEFKSRIKKDSKPEKVNFQEFSVNKRKFIKTSVASATGLVITSCAEDRSPADKRILWDYNTYAPVTPPGSLSLQNFNSKCISCHLCVSACITQVLQPGIAEYGVLNLFQPKMDFITSYCHYECNKCGYVCPTGAILPFPKEQKQIIQIGVAKFLKEKCLVVTDKKNCGACSEHCPTKACDMEKYSEGFDLKIPVMYEDLCVGCGACERACPVKPKRAIYVEANPIHKLAKRPVPKPESLEETEVEVPEENVELNSADSLETTPKDTVKLKKKKNFEPEKDEFPF